ncbi:U32 family peptidase [Halorhodospira abdelmalekii]|uniref:U32 family peptidase n=1 Tax=Halorhodospira abdelmalekii TaxID=421629 RepID=UPI001908B4C2|nr:U32 family peptidase [Halorhodospira abdelmalekii]MBK1734002.1 U32 family peptidase [Halorhodospira abdelmalekii]
MKISIGPIQYYWSKTQVEQFYVSLRNQVDTFYLGETVCGRRREMTASDWIGLGKELAAEGHEVVLSTLCLVEARSEAAQVRRLCENGELRVEANDFTAISFLEAADLPFVAGPTLNVYSGSTLRTLQGLGAVRWVPPVELPGRALAELLGEYAELGDAPAIETEVFAYGRLPLAFSARCFTARHYQRPKDDCEFVCRHHPEGLEVTTRAGQHFLTINGIQAQSFGCVNLLSALPEMQQMGVGRVRLSPRPEGMSEVVAAFRAAIRGEPSVALTEPAPERQCDGYWWGGAGCAHYAKTPAAPLAALQGEEDALRPIVHEE